MEHSSHRGHPIHVAWSEEDGEHVATTPAYPYLSALAETEDEAAAEFRTVLDLVMDKE